MRFFFYRSRTSITENVVCDKFSTNGKIATHEISCVTPTLAKYITIQVLNEPAILGIDEISYSNDELDSSECKVEGKQYLQRTFMDIKSR